MSLGIPGRGLSTRVKPVLNLRIDPTHTMRSFNTSCQREISYRSTSWLPFDPQVVERWALLPAKRTYRASRARKEIFPTPWATKVAAKSRARQAGQKGNAPTRPRGHGRRGDCRG